MPVQVMEHLYRGGRSIEKLRGGPVRCERSPEEWLASDTPRFGASTTGLSRMPDGSLLRDAIRAEPEAWLGREHVQRLGPQTGVLVKLLDAAERLPVHLHPTRGFARRHLSCAHGKTEAWVVLEAQPTTTVHLGFTEYVERAELDELVRSQDTGALLARMRELPLRPGDAVLVPAGLPHALGAGAFVVEVQEPTDFSILLDWQGFPVDGPAEGHLGLGFDVALEAVRRDPLTPEETEALFRRGALEAGPADLPRPLLPPASAPFFRADLVRPATGVELPAGFAVLVVLEGPGTLRPPSGEELPVDRGDVLALPHAAGPLSLHGGATAVLYRPSATAGTEDGDP